MWTLHHSSMFKTYVHQMLIPWRGCPSYLLSWHESQVVVSSVSVIPCNQVDNSCCPTGITRLPGAGLDVAIGPVPQHLVACTILFQSLWMRSDVMRPSMDAEDYTSFHGLSQCNPLRYPSAPKRFSDNMGSPRVDSESWAFPSIK